jgi:hypothetical protein
MKKSIFLVPVAALSIFACGSKSDKPADGADTVAIATTTEAPAGTATATDTLAEPFDINTIPKTDKDLGTFPYLAAPAKTEYINKGGKKSDLDQIFVPLKGILTPIEGPSFRAYVHAASGEQWQKFYVEKTYSDMITNLGGVKVSNEPVSKKEVDRIGTNSLQAGIDGSFDFWNQLPIQLYIIHKDSLEVYIQLQTNTSSGSIQIIERVSVPH